MFAFLFSFSGRLGRLQYFFGNIGVGLGAAVLLAAGFAVGIGSGHWALAFVFLFLGLLVTVPALMWIGVSMQARRFRDMGWNPIYAVPTYFFVVFADSLVAHAQPHLAVNALHSQTAFGVAFMVVVTLLLWLWPGVSADGGSDIDLEPVIRVFDAPPISVSQPALVGLPAPRPARKEFGRRGR